MNDYFDKYDDCYPVPPLTLEQANEKYKHVARIVECGIDEAVYLVYDAGVYGDGGYLQGTFGTLEDAIEECARLDNAEPADRQI